MMDDAISASSPDQNAVVMASAGTGKTWLLVTRILRLLMKDVPPASILAITFTRKAAAEMQIRLLDRLFEFMIIDEDLLADKLGEVGVTADGASIQRARRLYEDLLCSERQIRITTFHAFCHEI
jgi:ATP-dependent helicase/nuclease subunit A